MKKLSIEKQEQGFQIKILELGVDNKSKNKAEIRKMLIKKKIDDFEINLKECLNTNKNVSQKR